MLCQNVPVLTLDDLEKRSAKERIMPSSFPLSPDLSAVATPPEDSTEFASNSGTCSDSRISTDIKLRPGVFSSNFTNLGEANDIHRCISRCCIRPSCDIAYLLNNKCFAVQCLDGVMCQTNAEPAASGANVELAYMNRGGNAPKERGVCFSSPSLCLSGISLA